MPNEEKQKKEHSSEEEERQAQRDEDYYLIKLDLLRQFLWRGLVIAIVPIVALLGFLVARVRGDPKDSDQPKGPQP